MISGHGTSVNESSKAYFDRVWKASSETDCSRDSGSCIPGWEEREGLQAAVWPLLLLLWRHTERCESVRLLWSCIGSWTVFWVCKQFGISVSTISCLGSTCVAEIDCGSQIVLKHINEPGPKLYIFLGRFVWTSVYLVCMSCLWAIVGVVQWVQWEPYIH
jgi:hypothetical protein